MSTSDEAEALQWCIEQGLIEDPYNWSTWKLGNRRILPRFSSVGGQIMFNTKEVYHRRRKERGSDATGWPRWIWKYQYATKKEAFVTNLKEEHNV